MDAPGDYDPVYIDVQDVLITYNGDSDQETEISRVNTGVYDLLELTAGASVLLVDDEILSGRISQIRLVLGDNNTVVVDGQTFALDTPSAQQSGLKLNVNQQLDGGISNEFILDFDADQSIATQGNGSYSLNPVIRTELVAETGAISGSITSANVQSIITATDDVNVISTFNNAAGEFTLSGVPEGIYTISIALDVTSGLQTTTITGVVVTTGNVAMNGQTNLN